MRELGEVAAQHFDVVIVREDDNLRAPRARRDGRAGRRGRAAGDGRRRALQAGRDHPRRDRGGPARDGPGQRRRPRRVLRRQARRGDERAGDATAARPSRVARRGTSRTTPRRTRLRDFAARRPRRRAGSRRQPRAASPASTLARSSSGRRRRAAVLGRARRRPASRSGWHINATTSPGRAWPTSAARPPPRSGARASVTPARAAPSRISAPSSLERPAPQVLVLVRDRHHVGAAAPPISPSRTKRRRCGRRPSRPEQQPRPGRPDPVHDLQQRLEPGLVVGQVDHHADGLTVGRPARSRCSSGRGCARPGRNVAQPLGDLLARRTRGPARRRPRPGRSRR